tara:strand:- start:267 stop:683 length:417 start_codon:yes stop_codon:yes gene_type:complete
MLKANFYYYQNIYKNKINKVIKLNNIFDIQNNFEFEEIFNSIYYNNNINKILNNNKFNVKYTNNLINNFINWFENYYIGFNFLTKNELIHILKFYNRNFDFNNFNIQKLIKYLKNIILHFLFKFTKFLKFYYYEILLN